MSDQEEEDEDYNEESEEATSDEEGSDDNIEDDSGDDESPPVRSKSDTNRSGKSGEEKEDAKKAGMKRKAEKIREEKVKKIRSEKKTAASSAIKSADNKGKKIPKKSASEKEVQADPVKALPKKESKKESKKTNEIATESGEKNYPVFEEKNIDYNFVKNSSLNVVQRRCQIAPNIILQCKNVEFTQNGQQIDFASLTFSRKTKNGRAFDYNMPLSLIICRTCKFLLICFNKNGKWNMTLKELFEIECIICHLPLLSETKQFIAKMKKFPLK